MGPTDAHSGQKRSALAARTPASLHKQNERSAEPLSAPAHRVPLFLFPLIYLPRPPANRRHETRFALHRVK
jgi:hypothetical protein